LNRIRINSELVYSLESFGQPAFRVATAETGADVTVWSGVLRYWGTTLEYRIRVGDTVSGTPSFVIEVEDVPGSGTYTAAVTTSGLVANTTYVGTASLTGLALTKGTVYKVRVRAVTADLEVCYLATRTSPTYTWTAFASLADGTVWTPAQWAILRNNLLYLYDQLAGAWTPTHADLGSPIATTPYADLGDDAKRNDPETIWRGWIQHRADALAYRLGGWATGPGINSDQPICLVYCDPDTSVPPVVTFANPLGIAYDYAFGNLLWGRANTRPPSSPGHDANADTTGDFYATAYVSASQPHTVAPFLAQISTSTDDDLVSPDTPLDSLSKGTWYEIRCMRHEHNSAANADAFSGACQIVYEVQGVPDTADYSPIDAFAHGEYVDGTSSDLATLVANLTELKTRVDNYPSLLCPIASDLWFYRRGDVLLWSGNDVTLSYTPGRWPKRGLTASSKSLGSTSGTGVFDLRSLSGHAPGQLYSLSGNSIWALEVFEEA